MNKKRKNKSKNKSNKRVVDFIVHPNIEFDVADLLKEIIEKEKNNGND